MPVSGKESGRVEEGGPAGPGQDQPVRRGPWQGQVLDGIECYYGIRYGRLPRQGQRFGWVVAAAAEQLDVDELTEVPVFPQLPSRLESVTGRGGRINPQADDAFFLNVWVPRAALRLPVLVFVHGGAWASGGGAMRWYRGQHLAAEGLVVVTLNYRLGPAGHLDGRDAGARAVATGGIHRPFGDLLAALRWLREHIAVLGGDPDRVTLAGQSAGAWYAWALASLPEAEGLLSQVALLSIPSITPWTAAYRAQFTDRVHAVGAQTLGENAGVATPAEALLRASAQVLGETPRVPGAMPPMYLPTLTEEQASLLESAHSAAQRFHARALYVRVTLHEMSAFLPPTVHTEAGAAELLGVLQTRAGKQRVPSRVAPAHWPSAYARIVELSSWLEFGRFAGEIAAETAGCGHPVVERRFSALASPSHLGATHCMDLPFQFGNFPDWADAPILENWTREEFESLSCSLRTDLAQFAQGRHEPTSVTLGGMPPTSTCP